MIDNVNDPRFDEIAEAKKQGHAFIKVYLHHSKIGRHQTEISIGGSVGLRGIRKGGTGPMDEEFEFLPEKDSNMVFKFDRNEREFICWLYDDLGKGYFSPKGYNRDLLATHFNDKDGEYKSDYFKIKDAIIYADVKKRFEYLKDNPPKREMQKHTYDPQGNVSAKNQVEDLDSQIEFLKSRKEQVLKNEDEKQAERQELEQEYEDLKKKPEMQKPPEEKRKPGRPKKETVTA